MIVTGTHFNYYQLCHRKLWLFANGINMEQESDLVYEGKLVHESSYPQRTSKYEEVDRNTFLSQKVEQSTICPQTSKGIQFRNILNRNISRLLLDFFIIFIHDNRRELQRIVPSLHNAWIEQIKTSFHSSSSNSFI